MTGPYRNKGNLFSRRDFITEGAKLLAIGVLLTRYFSLQIGKHGKFDELLLGNHMRSIAPAKQESALHDKIKPMIKSKACCEVKLNPSFINTIELINDREYCFFESSNRASVNDFLKRHSEYKIPDVIFACFPDMLRL